MNGFELSGLVRFFAQVGVAVAGAASLWGLVLALKKEKGLSDLLMWPFLIGFLVFVISWLLATLVFFPANIFGHEGIVIKTTEQFITVGMEASAIFIVALAFLTFVSAFLYFNHRIVFRKYAATLFGLKFLVISVIAFLGVFTGQWDRVQIFLSLHGWHSILTLGTVIMVDFMYAVSLRRDELKNTIYRLFFYMSAAIWIGLGIDFISVFLILEEVFEVDTQLIFNQTLVGIVIINGALLSGVVNDKLIDFAKKGKALTPALNNTFSLLGSISIVSWTSITFLDFFEFNFSYLAFMTLYIFVIIFFFLCLSFARKLNYKL